MQTITFQEKVMSVTKFESIGSGWFTAKFDKDESGLYFKYNGKLFKLSQTSIAPYQILLVEPCTEVYNYTPVNVEIIVKGQ